jgi:hypothetical protein
LTYLFASIVGTLVLTVVGDAWFIRALRTKSPAAFAEAGQPGVWVVGLLPPMLSSRYCAFVVLRKYKQFLPPGSELRLAGNLLYVAHVALPGLIGLLALSSLRS